MQYNLKIIRISKLSRKDDLATKYLYSIPAPTKYNPRPETVMTHSLVASFPKSVQKIKPVDNDIGPGSYDVPSLFGKEGRKVIWT